MSSQVGNSPSSWNAYNASFNNNLNQIASEYTMPTPGGTITDVYVYAAGHGASVNAQLVIWAGSNGAVLWNSSTFSMGKGSGVYGGQSWQHQTISSGLYVAGGTAIWIGWWYNPSGGSEFSVNTSGGGTHWMTNAPSSGAGSFTGSTSVSINGESGTYALYNPAELYVNTGTSATPNWSTASVYVNTGTPVTPTWSPVGGIYVNTGTSVTPTWTPGG